MKTPILLHIPEPCHENWDAMTPQDKGRHCQSCNKVVVDFSVMSDRQVLDYFKNATGNTCGRFHNDQLQRPLVEPQKQPGKWGYFLASIVSLIITTKTFAQQKILPRKIVGKPNVERVTTKGECAKPVVNYREDKLVGDIAIMAEDTAKPKAIGDTIIAKKELPEIVVKSSNVQTRNLGIVAYRISDNLIKGKVIDEKGNQIIGATIKIKGTRIGVSSDVNGKFELNKLGENSKLVFVVSSIGFETKEIEVIPKNLQGELNIVLNESKQVLDEVFVQVPYGTVKKYTTVGGVCSVHCTKLYPSIKDTLIKKVQQVFNKESIKIYPNPAPKNSIIHIAIKDAGEYALQMFDIQSKLMVARKIVTNANNEITEFELPVSAINGTYFIRIINEKTQKQVTEKIIVQ